MQTQHFATRTCQAQGMNYTISEGTQMYQKSLEWREFICYRLTETFVPLYKKMFKPSDSKWRVQLDKLRSYPTGSLGNSWARFYEDQSFGISPNYEAHDICHVILGYKTSIVEETRMYSFLFGSGKRSIPTILTILIGCLILPEFIPQFYTDFKLGQKSLNFSKWDFRYLLRESVQDLRLMIFQKEIQEGKAVLF